MIEAIQFDVESKSKKLGLKRTWKCQDEEDSRTKDLCKGAVCRSKIIGVNRIVTRLRLIQPPSVVGDTTEIKSLASLCISILVVISTK